MREYRGFNWGAGLYLIIYHIALALIVPWYLMHYTVSAGVFWWTFGLMICCGLAITGGYHRYFAHTTYKANRVVELFLLFFGTMSGQSSVFRWSYDHRLHHAYLDTDRDPYSITRGFWHAHMGWLFEKPTQIDYKVISDLTRDPVLHFQHKYYDVLLVLSNALVWLVAGYACNDYVGTFIFVWWFRQFLHHHFTWFINSLAHTWGARTFSKELTAVDNYMISLVTFGEGYHNYHHAFANDYRNGIRWYHFDPTKWFVWTLSKIGLTHHLKRVTSHHIQKRIVQERREELLDWIKRRITTGREALEEKVRAMSDELLAKQQAFNEAVETYRAQRKQRVSKAKLKQLREEIKVRKKSLKENWRAWKQLCRHVRRPGAPLPA